MKRGRREIYKKPDIVTKHILNPLLSLGMKLGISFYGSRILSVNGRKSGKPYTTPVNPLEFEGSRYLVAPRGETGWVRNIRASGKGELRLGRKREVIKVEEVSGDVKLTIMRNYLKKWKWEAGQFFDGVGAESSEPELRAEAPKHPMFRITSSSPQK